eukprot:TRINITY_DN9306_c0_g1_i1.p1 TRINITY_DN9306_c0_g1~~TRINITY_DN9306_c0_g1_i1.p1  ORF type:complete len:315 (-),score=123.84 TRINITY_DN9306_c0_g1_i1:57-1001(-)
MKSFARLLLALVASSALVEGVVIKQESNQLVTMEAEQASAEELSSDRYFGGAFDAMEAELQKLKDLIVDPAKVEKKAKLDEKNTKVTTKQVESKDAPDAAASKAVVTASKVEQKGEPTKVETVKGEESKTVKVSTKVEKDLSRFPKPPPLNFKPMHKGKAELAMSMAMLEGLYESGKDRIKDMNAKEKKSKEFFEAKDKENTEKVAEIDGKFKAGKLSQKFHDDELKDRKRMFSYWQRVRERQHKQYINALKIQHGTMKKTGKLLELYKKALSGNPKDEEEAKKELSKMMGPLGLIQIEDQMKELKTERSQLKI